MPIGFLQEQTTAVARFTVSRYGAAMSKTRERVDRSFNQPVTGLVIHLSDQAETTAVFLEFRPIKTLGAHRLHPSLHEILESHQNIRPGVGVGATHHEALAKGNSLKLIFVGGGEFPLGSGASNVLDARAVYSRAPMRAN
jgi:hypothetical protein